MKAVVAAGAGGPEVLGLREVAIPAVQPDSVLVRVKAAGLNRPDIAQRLGRYPPPKGVTEVLGLEVARPKLLLLDEPSLGLSPLLVQSLFQIIRRVHESGVSILLVEQNARLALAIISYGYILENGEMRFHKEAAALRDDPQVQEAYLGA